MALLPGTDCQARSEVKGWELQASADWISCQADVELAEEREIAEMDVQLLQTKARWLAVSMGRRRALNWTSEINILYESIDLH